MYLSAPDQWLQLLSPVGGGSVVLRLFTGILCLVLVFNVVLSVFRILQ